MSFKTKKQEPTLLEILEQKRDKRSKPTNYISQNMKEGDVLVPYSDIHWGSPHCNKELFFENLEKSWENKNSYLLFNGDMIEAATRSSIGAGIYEQKIHTGKQLEDIIEILKPFAEEGRIIGLTNGNHEDRIVQSTGVDVTKIMSKELGVPFYKHGGHFKFRVGDNNYHAYFTHGKSGSRLPHTKIKACLNLEDFVWADLYGIGHVHDLQHHAQEIQYIDNRSNNVKKKDIHYIICGHYLDWKNSYAQQASMAPSKQGTPIVEFSGEKDKKYIKIQM